LPPREPRCPRDLTACGAAAEPISTFRIQAAEAGDQHLLWRLYRQLNPADPPWPSDAVAGEALAHVLAREGSTIFIGELDGIGVSTCMLVVSANFARRGRPFALIENVVTDQEHRKRGFGGKVVAHAIELARQQGCYRVSMLTGSREEATLRFYERAGLRRSAKIAFEARFP
jgi:GNAT superfamily N-acetyltransferase